MAGKVASAMRAAFLPRSLLTQPISYLIGFAATLQKHHEMSWRVKATLVEKHVAGTAFLRLNVGSST